MHFMSCGSYIELSSVCPEMTCPGPGLAVAAGVVLHLTAAFSLMFLLVHSPLFLQAAIQSLCRSPGLFLGVKFCLSALSHSGQLGFPRTLCSRAETVLSVHIPHQCAASLELSPGRRCGTAGLASSFSFSPGLSTYWLTLKTLASYISSGCWLVYHGSVCHSGSCFYMGGGRRPSFFLFCFVFMFKIWCNQNSGKSFSCFTV